MTDIEWTDKTWNPVTGCDQISPGCDNCYAAAMARRLKAMGNPRYQNNGNPRTSGPGFGVTVHPDKLTEPLQWRKPRRVFVNSMSDPYHPDVPTEFIDQVWDTMTTATWHTFQILTKRPQRAAQLAMPPPPNVWIGTSIETNNYLWRADHLRNTPATVRFLSLEPLLGPLPNLNLDGIDWVIVGGESGPKARPMHPDWVRDIRDQCTNTRVPFFFKQWGTWTPITWTNWNWQGPRPDTVLEPDGTHYHGGDPFGPGMTRGAVPVRQVGKKTSGRVLDDRTWNQTPDTTDSEPKTVR